MYVNILKPFAVSLLSLSLLIFTAQGFAAENLSSGSFKGASGHVTKGSVTVVKTDSGIKVVLEDDFYFDGAPDPKVGFGKNGKYDGNSQLDVLRKDKGKQTYNVPASLSIDGYNEIYIWCKKYSVPLGVAEIR